MGLDWIPDSRFLDIIIKESISSCVVQDEIPGLDYIQDLEKRRQPPSSHVKLGRQRRMRMHPSLHVNRRLLPLPFFLVVKDGVGPTHKE
jgi:hypothetical protein